MTAGAVPDSRAPWERARDHLYDRIKQLAKEKGTSLTEMASALGYSRGGIPNMMHAKKGPNFRLLMELAGYLGCHSIEELMGDFGSREFLQQMRPPGS